MIPARLAAGLSLALVLSACGQREGDTRDAEALPDSLTHDATMEGSGSTAAPDTTSGYTPDFTGMSQKDAGIETIFAILTGSLDTIRPHFEEEVRPNITEEHAKILRGQFGWLYDLIGGEFEQFMTGWSLFPDSTPGYYREYRMVNETNKRAPFILVHLVFADSVTPYAAGAQVKNYLSGGKETRLSGEQTWNIDGKNVDIHEVKVVETDSGGMVAVLFFDTDPDPLDSPEKVARRGIPVARAAVARGLIDSARVARSGRRITEDIGVGFIRNDPQYGHIRVNVGFTPEDYRE